MQRLSGDVQRLKFHLLSAGGVRRWSFAARGFGGRRRRGDGGGGGAEMLMPVAMALFCRRWSGYYATGSRIVFEEHGLSQGATSPSLTSTPPRTVGRCLARLGRQTRRKAESGSICYAGWSRVVVNCDPAKPLGEPDSCSTGSRLFSRANPLSDDRRELVPDVAERAGARRWSGSSRNEGPCGSAGPCWGTVRVVRRPLTRRTLLTNLNASRAQSGS